MSKAVMTIHGFLTDVADFGDLYDSLGDYDCVYKCKIPGHNGKVNFNEFNVADTLATVRSDYDMLREKYDQVDVIGFSMGGALTSYLCSVRDVHRAVLCAPSNKYLNFRSLFAMLSFYFKTYNEKYQNSNGAVAARMREANDYLKPYRNNSLLSIRIGIRRILPNINSHTYSVFRDLMKLCNDALKERQSIDVPAMVVWGKLDELVPRSSADFVCDFFTYHKLKLYDDVGHALFLTNNSPRLIRDIVQYLEMSEDEVRMPDSNIVAVK
ncbi:MAG TPA: alpha/beta fold hydrolase [Candidatus Limihabitans stercoravium]|nr:alpha/beta fold hydrolase [Candidatus Limihabitans stercoravium]